MPLPMVSYSHKSSEQFQYTVGLPASSVNWTPADRWTVNATYLVPITANATVDYQLTDRWHLFGAFENRFSAHHIDGDSDHRRLFFIRRQLEAGVRWAAAENVQLIVAGGYAFGQKFTRGYDVRDTDTVRKISDEPYIRAAVAVGF